MKAANLQPHRIRYWLGLVLDEQRDERIRDVCTTYERAIERKQMGERTISTDEMTGVQALERMHLGLGMRPGSVERREFEYIRHGTRTFIINLDVATGEIVSPSCGATRTEADFAAHIQRTVESDPTTLRWHFVSDNLNTHCSETLVRYVAKHSGITEDLGEPRKGGVLHDMKSRGEFLRNPRHKIVFHYTPKHASWMNQVEIWLGILVRKVIRRGNFLSPEDLTDKVLRFIDYFNRTMAKPFRWTYQGKPLLA